MKPLSLSTVSNLNRLGMKQHSIIMHTLLFLYNIAHLQTRQQLSSLTTDPCPVNISTLSLTMEYQASPSLAQLTATYPQLLNGLKITVEGYLMEFRNIIFPQMEK